MTLRSMLAHLARGPQRVAVALAVSLNGFLEWLFASKHPTIVFVRETIRGNRILISGARALIGAIRALPTLQQTIRQTFKSQALQRLEAILAARMAGGSITVGELEQLWSRSRRGSCALVLASGAEREQIEIVLKAHKTRVTACARGKGASAAEAVCHELIVVGPGVEEQEPVLDARFAQKILRLGQSGQRSTYSSATPNAEGSHVANAPLAQKLAAGEPLHVVFLNDVGFQYGAGVALKRQVASLLLKGFEVSVVAWLPGTLRDPPEITGVKRFTGWRGVHGVNDIHASKGLDDGQIIEELTTRIAAFDPDVVITGNLHGSGWPLALLPALRSRGITVVAFMHDTYFVTGRCAQPMTCQLYRTGCDANCPTPNEYPRLAPEKIAPAWRERGAIFGEVNPVPLIGNSRWTANIVKQRFGRSARSGFVHLALDHELFAPMSKAVVRRLLGVPEGKVIVALGAVDVHNQWKGGPLFHGLHQALLKREEVGLVLFGRSSETLGCLRSFGLVTDERLMPFILNAADIFVSTATAESFGQSLLEAAACAVPVVAFDVGAVGEVVLDNETGILVKELKVEGLLNAIDRLVADPAMRERFGRAGRAHVENGFTLIHQADAWIDCLKRMC
jgi:glycosyltransferase involved in cell wall biosynthesis